MQSVTGGFPTQKNIHAESKLSFLYTMRSPKSGLSY